MEDFNDTNLWKHRWLHGNSNGKVSTPKPEGSRLQKVSELIINHRWNRVLIFKVFRKEDAEHILNTPISLADRVDCMTWGHCRNGQYTIASGFKILQQRRREKQEDRRTCEGCSYQQMDNKLWKALWKLPIKQKLKIFVLKCIQNGMPVKDKIFQRTQKGDPICCRCGEAVETIEHVLSQCKQARDIWKCAPLHWDGLEDQTGCFNQWWKAMMQARNRSEGEDHISLTVYVLWHIWKTRNDRIFSETKHKPFQVSEKAKEEWMENREARQQQPRKSTTETMWHHDNNRMEQRDLDIMTMKLVIQHQTNSKTVGIGLTASNASEQGMAAWSLRERQSSSKRQDYADAIRLCLIKAAEKDWRKVRILLADKKLLSQLQAHKVAESGIATILKDIQKMTS